ncbi:MAG: Txe/YoeB family addiction module toxin [Salinivirgaceae bacterium]|nr:Txe/YoeB family addiction module toxin [Salinivirgaceae bacterium]MDY0281567.1 Txe/YoeB family addiction module toxin [Salinivirgaceae bacterium]
MGKYSLELSTRARNELLLHYKSGNKITIRRIEKILEELPEHPFTGLGNPEPLKYQLTGTWSRRLNKKDRIVYAVLEQSATIIIISAKGHYL